MDLERRKPVWIAISDLCLDTEVTDMTIAYIARTIREQGFTTAEAEEIAFREVFPVIFPNMLSLAGEWAGFEEDWLINQIIQKKKIRKSRFRRWWDKCLFNWMLKPDWNRVLVALRDA